MKKIFITAVMFGLLVATPAAFAGSGHNRGGNSGNGRGHSEAGSHGNFGGNSASHISAQGRANSNGPNAGTRLFGQDRANARRSARSLAHNNAIYANRHFRSRTARHVRNASSAATRNALRTNRTSRASRIGATRRRTTIAALRRNVQATRRFNVAAYRQPRGYVARRWGYGERLPSAYFARGYWINDYASFGLFAPSYGLVWVRVGGDSLLVDEYTGEVIQADYGVFF